MSNYFPGKGLYTFFSGGLNLQDIQTAFSSTNDSDRLNESNESNDYNVVYAEECMKESSNEENEKLKEENENLKKRIEIDNALDKIHKSIPSMNEVNEMLDKVFSSN